ncbi:hypothetical protein DFP73DRAFT_532446 [Morchella snyderi]|nr:hypothetical protein DFP73DRAFT_532446 [Morchella snyderi]
MYVSGMPGGGQQLHVCKNLTHTPAQREGDKEDQVARTTTHPDEAGNYTLRSWSWFKKKLHHHAGDAQNGISVTGSKRRLCLSEYTNQGPAFVFGREGYRVLKDAYGGKRPPRARRVMGVRGSKTNWV